MRVGDRFADLSSGYSGEIANILLKDGDFVDSIDEADHWMIGKLVIKLDECGDSGRFLVFSVDDGVGFEPLQPCLN